MLRMGNQIKCNKSNFKGIRMAVIECWRLLTDLLESNFIKRKFNRRVRKGMHKVTQRDRVLQGYPMYFISTIHPLSQIHPQYLLHKFLGFENDLICMRIPNATDEGM